MDDGVCRCVLRMRLRHYEYDRGYNCFIHRGKVRTEGYVNLYGYIPFDKQATDSTIRAHVHYRNKKSEGLLK